MKKILSFFLALIIVIGIVPIAELDLEANAAYENTWTNTGEQRKDIVEIAKTQIGYTEGNNNNNKYGAESGQNYVSWCAYFIVWCARQAGIDSSVIKSSGYATADDLGVTYIGRPANRSIDINYVPQAGDLIFFDWGSNGYNYSSPASAHGDHVGLVEFVENGVVHTIEGNSDDKVKRNTYSLKSNDIKGYGIPNYKNSTHIHSYNGGYEAAHPHKYYEKCNCGDWYYTGTDLMSVTQTSYESVHPHREYKHCTMCNENFLTGTTKKLSNCSECNIPGKPQIILNEMYTSDQTITFNWSDTDNTTHYNLVIEKKNSNGLYEKYYRKDYASSGVIKKLEPGFYRAEIQSYNSNFFYDDGSDWIHTLSDYEYFIVNNSEGIFETTYIVMYENKGIVSIPYSIGNLVKTAKQNDEIAIIGYVFNCYGNLWLKTSEGYYIAFSGLKQKESDRIPIAEYNTAKMEVTCSSKSVFQDMISTSPVVETLKCGDLIEIDGYCYNQNGYLMYHLPNGYFVFSSYLKCITSDKNSPSNYVQAELKSFASVKELHEAPHSSSNITRKISKGDTVNIVGYEYNQYGNLWYLTDSGDYIYESYLSNYKKAENIPSDYKCQPFISTEAKLCQSEPYAAASLKQIFKSNTVINTVGYLNNLYGNKWYVCENGGYIYSGTSNLECNHLFEKTTIDSSCIHKGKEIITCKYCNYYQEKELALIPHNFSEWKIEVLATVHHKGTFKRMCLNCKQAEIYESPCVLKNCFIMDGFISGLKPGCNLEFFKENYTNSENISIYTSTKKITTNTEIIFGYSDNSYDTLKVVIRGDVDCDGLIDGRDSFIVDCLVNNLLSKDQVGEAVFTAADCNRNGEIDAEDIALLEGAGLKLNTIEQI